MNIPSNIMIHHSAVMHAKNPDQFLANNSYHKNKWNFKSSLGFFLGYNYEISALGRIRQARVEGETTAACYQKSMNDGRCIHICLDGNFEIEKPTDDQVDSLRFLLMGLMCNFSIVRENIFFHKQFANTACPGKNLKLDFIRSLGGLARSTS